MELSRREALLGTLFGAGWIGLRSLATGLPVSFLLNPRAAVAAAASAGPAQFLILSTSGAGDPMGCNAPGTYPDAYSATNKVAHPPAVPGDDTMDMASTAITVGGKTYQAAKPWSTLEAGALARTCFFHHTTLTNNHTNEGKVLKLMGAVKRQEMLVSLCAKSLAPTLGTIQKEPVAVGSETLQYEGRSLPRLSPTGLRAALANPAGPLANLQALRDADLDRLNALLKASGTTAERQFLDRMAQSQVEARNISQSLLDNLTGIANDGQDNQIVAAVTLLAMKVSPVVAIRLDFGGDNHTDAALVNEAKKTVSAVKSINYLFTKLDELGLRDRVTFAAMNVFGRTLSFKGTGTESAGRDHLANHHCTLLIGKGVKAGVIGGLEANGNDFKAMALSSATGQGVPKDQASGADIAFADTLGAVGKTLGAVLGVPAQAVEDNITQGKVVTAALA
jgi:Protein of unknown function (DUF1501)